ncbi:MAG: ABC transporter permease [Oscillospiraceae bacterium]
MWRYILKRLVMMIFVVLGVAILIFTIMYFTPGDPAQIILGSSATDEQIYNLRENMGLNRPFMAQLGSFLYNTFIKFDFGTSYISRASVSAEILVRMPRTLLIAVICMILSTIIGLPLGIIAAVHQDKWQDTVSIALSLIGVSIPGFWLALMLVLVFSVKLGWLPAFGIGGIEYYILPCVSNSIASLAINARQTRSAMLDVIRSDYVTTALAKGVSQRSVIYKHALPNALIPVITTIGGSFAGALGGTVIIESIFSIPGIGSYMTSAINSRDYPVVRGSVVILAISFSIIMLLVDLIYAAVDPRIKAQYAGKR